MTLELQLILNTKPEEIEIQSCHYVEGLEYWLLYGKSSSIAFLIWSSTKTTSTFQCSGPKPYRDSSRSVEKHVLQYWFRETQNRFLIPLAHLLSC